MHPPSGAVKVPAKPDASSLPRGGASSAALRPPTHPTTHFPFLSLPLELREQIYSHLLAHHFPIPIYNAPPYFPHLSPSILRVSRRIHSEASRALYSNNVFHLHSYSRLFLDTIGEHNRGLVRRLVVDWDVREEYQTGFKKVFSVLGGMRLRRVVVMVDGDRDYPSLGCMRGCVRGYGMADVVEGEEEGGWGVVQRGKNGDGEKKIKTKVEFRFTGERRGLWVSPHLSSCFSSCIPRPPLPIPPPPSPFLLLPFSIRQRIYALLIPTNKTLDLRLHLSEVSLSHPPTAKAREYLHPPRLLSQFRTAYFLLLTCKAISKEVSQFIYGGNTVRVYADALHAFDVLGATNFGHLREVEVYYELEEHIPDVYTNTPNVIVPRAFERAVATYSIHNPPEHSFNAPRYLDTILRRFESKGALEKLTVYLTMLEGRVNWAEGEDCVVECCREYGGVLRVLVEWSRRWEGEVRVVYCGEWMEDEVWLEEVGEVLGIDAAEI